MTLLRRMKRQLELRQLAHYVMVQQIEVFEIFWQKNFIYALKLGNICRSLNLISVKNQ